MKQSVLNLLYARHYFIACFAIDIALRLAILVLLPIHQTSDFQWYYDRGIEMASGAGYAENGVPTAFWPVGWPGFLGVLFWIFGTSQLVGQIANVVLSAIVFVLTAHIATALTKHPLIPRLAVLALAIYPNQIAYVPLLSTEIFYEALILVSIALLSMETIQRGLLAGIVFGIAMLTKAQTLFLPGLVILCAWLQGRPRAAWQRYAALGVAVYIGVALPVVPWIVRNYQIFGAFIPVSTNGGITLLTGNNPSADGGFTTDDPLVRMVSHDPRQQVQMDRQAKGFAMDWIESHPGRFIALLPRKVWHLWAPDGEAEWFYQAGYLRYDTSYTVFRIFRIINQAYYVSMIVLAGLSWRRWAWLREMRCRWLVSGWVAVAYFTAISMVFSGQSRFHFALMPWIAIYASITLAHYLEPPGTMRSMDGTVPLNRRVPLSDSTRLPSSAEADDRSEAG
jgi:hypothetical protein